MIEEEINSLEYGIYLDISFINSQISGAVLYCFGAYI